MNSLAELSPGLLTFAPAIFIAWADGELTREEILELRELITSSGQLSPENEAELAQFLDPASPPTDTALRQLLRSIRRHAANLGAEQRQSLAALGSALARANGTPTDETGALSKALQDLESALGITKGELSREVLEREPRSGALPVVAKPTAGVKRRLAFDPQALQSLLDGKHHALRQQVREFLCQDALARPDQLLKNEHREHVLHCTQLVGKQGWGALAFPRAHGGEDDLERFMVVFETLALHDLNLTVKFGVQFGLFGGSILFLGTDKHHERFLPGIGKAELLGCFAMTETGHGSNVRDLETTATFDPEQNEWVIHSPTPSSRKDYIGNAAAHGRWATVFAQLHTQDECHGVHAFLVPIRNPDGSAKPGVTISDCGTKLGLNGIDNGRLKFNQVRIPADNLLDRFASVDPDGAYQSPIASEGKRFFTMLGTLVGGRVSVAAAGLSAAKVGLTIAIRYAETRRQFGEPDQAETVLLDYPSHQLRLMPLLARAYVADAAITKLRVRFVTRDKETMIETEHLAAAIKAWSTTSASATLQECRECCGGAGYLAENRFADLRADSDVFTTFEGDNTVLLQLVAKGCLTRFRQRFGDMRSLLRYVARRAVTAVTERNPVRTRRTDEGHLRDAEFQLEAFRLREERLLSSLAGRLRERLQGGMDAAQAVLECQNHMLTLAKAHTETQLLKAMDERVQSASPELQGVLLLMRDLFALDTLHQHAAWYLARDYFEGSKAKAIRALREELCAELRLYAGDLVSAFGIPEASLAAPIAQAPSPVR